MRIFRQQSGGRQLVEWEKLISSDELARHVNEKTSQIHAETRWPEWWALRCSRRLAMEPWAQDLAAAYVIRKLRESGARYEIFDVSPTLALLLTDEEKAALEFPDASPVPQRSGILAAFLRWMFKRLRNRWLLRRLPKPWKDQESCDLLIHTVILADSVTPEGWLNDFFFPDVQACAEVRGRRVLTFGLAAALPSRLAASWSRVGNWAVFDELIGCREFRRAWDAARRVRRRIEQWNGEVTGVSNAWLRTRWLLDLECSEFFDSIAAASWAGAFCQSRKVGHYLYSFERKTFEQAILKAVHEDSPATVTCGYQNAAVTAKHYHFWSYTAGSDVIPHRILTVGEITTDLMAVAGRYPRERLRVGGSLRQRSLLGRRVLRRPVQNLLVLLAEGRDQYEKFWSFLKQAWEQTDLSRFALRVRPHPAIPFDFPGYDTISRFEIDPLPDIRQSIDWADCILYASTSLAIVAAGSGIPVISVRLPGYFDDDCLPPGEKMLHWRVDHPGGLKGTLERIEELYDEDFEERLAASASFQQRYFAPSTADKFLEALEANGSAAQP